MSDKLAELARQRESLILRSDGQRERLADSVDQLRRSLQWAHLAKGMIQRIAANPSALVGVTATALIAGARKTKFGKISNLFSLGWTLFRAVRARRARRGRFW
ncbi:MAG TPA: hypothetical protein VGL11_07430 [Candidatus Binatia bacterium]|jgi:hypothetical protein